MLVKIRIALSGLFAFTILAAASAQSQQVPQASPQNQRDIRADKQDKEFTRFELQIVEPLRSKHSERQIAPVEFSSQRVRSLLPEVRIFVAAGAYTDDAGPYLLWADRFINLKGGYFMFPEPFGGIGTNKTVSDFMASQNIVIHDQDDANELGQLIEEFTLAAQNLSNHYERTRYFTYYDPNQRLLGPLANTDDWKYVSRRLGDKWLVTREFVGPKSTSIMSPPVWMFDVDENQKIVQVRQLHHQARGLKSIDAEFIRQQETLDDPFAKEIGEKSTK